MKTRVFHLSDEYVQARTRNARIGLAAGSAIAVLPPLYIAGMADSDWEWLVFLPIAGIFLLMAYQRFRDIEKTREEYAKVLFEIGGDGISIAFLSSKTTYRASDISNLAIQSRAGKIRRIFVEISGREWIRFEGVDDMSEVLKAISDLTENRMMRKLKWWQSAPS
jgi:hypothetical protein|tara:strand:+ start:74 stop:568 length:495 start_codon:yes stop_codon:yes gene_type:complete